MRHLALVALAGCYQPAHLAGDGGSPGDGADASDATIVSTCAAPRFASASAMVVAANVASVTMSADETYALVATTSPLKIGLLRDLTGAGAIAPISALDGLEHPAVSPDGTDLFAHIAAGSNDEAMSNGDPANWVTLAGTVAGLQDTDLPSTPGLAGAQLRMVIPGANAMTEYARGGSSVWSVKFTTNLTYAIVDPSMSTDGKLLVFVASGAIDANVGIYYARRTSTDVAFSMPTLPNQQVVAGKYGSPILTTDCQRLYAIDATTGQLIVLR